MQSIRLIRPLLLLLLVAGPFAVGARAHQTFPGQILLRPGTQDDIHVLDLGGCGADITVTSTKPGQIEVYAYDMLSGLPLPGTGITATATDTSSQAFLVKVGPSVQAPLSGTVEVCWIGSDWPGFPCNENNCSPYFPRVIPVQVVPWPTSIGARSYAGWWGDPVQLLTGALFLSERVVEIDGPLPVEFVTFYHSSLQAEGQTSSALGVNFSSNLSWRTEATGFNQEVHSPDGRVFRFERGYFGSSWTRVGSDDVPAQLVEQGGQLRFFDPRDGMTLGFSFQGHLQSIDDNHGNVLTVTNPTGLPQQISDGLGRSLSFSYNGQGRLATVSHGARTWSYSYDGLGQRTQRTDPGGLVVQYAYAGGSPVGRIVSISDPDGSVDQINTWNGAGQVIAQTDALTNTTTFSYDQFAGTTTVTVPGGDQTVHTHTPEVQLSQVVDPEGGAVALGYTPQGWRDSITARDGGATTQTFDLASGLPDVVTDADGSQTDHDVTASSVGPFTAHDVTQVTRADGTVATYGYDGDRNVTSYTQPGGQGWSWTYGARGNVLTETTPASGITTFSYGSNGSLASLTDPASRTTTFTYDLLGRRTGMTHPDGSSATWGYDDLDRMTAYTDEEGATTQYGYDFNGNLESITRPLGGVITLEYDVLDRHTRTLDPLGNPVLEQGYDALGRVISQTDAGGHTTTYSYDSRDRLLGLNTPLGATWSVNWGSEGPPQSITDPQGGTTQFAYDDLGRVIGATDPQGHAVQLALDLLGRVLELTDPTGRKTAYSYDANGSLLSTTTDEPGVATSVVHGALGEVTQRTDPGGNSWSYGHDNQGRRTTQTDPLGRTTLYSYGDRSQVETVTYPGTGGSAVLGRDNRNRLTSYAHSDGTSIGFVYDPNERLTGGTNLTLSWDAANNVVDTNGVQHTYNALGQRVSSLLAPGKQVTYSYYPDGQCASMTDWSGRETSIQYDLRGLPIQRDTELAPGGPTLRETNDYDAAGNLVQRIVTNFGSLSGQELLRFDLAYDKSNRILESTRTGALAATPTLGSTAFAYDAASQETSSTYDDRGRLLDDGKRSLSWNGASQLVNCTQGGTTVGFTYDSFGNTVSRTEGGTTTDFVIDYAAQNPLPVVERQSGLDVRFTVTLPSGEPICTIDGATDEIGVFFFSETGDNLGKVGGNGDVTCRHAYGPFGQELASTGNCNDLLRFKARDGCTYEPIGDFTVCDHGPFDGVTGRSFLPDACVFEPGPLADALGDGTGGEGVTDPIACNPYADPDGNPIEAKHGDAAADATTPGRVILGGFTVNVLESFGRPMVAGLQVQYSSAARRESVNNLKQLALAIHNAQNRRAYDPAAGQPAIGWGGAPLSTERVFFFPTRNGGSWSRNSSSRSTGQSPRRTLVGFGTFSVPARFSGRGRQSWRNVLGRSGVGSSLRQQIRRALVGTSTTPIAQLQEHAPQRWKDAVRKFLWSEHAKSLKRQMSSWGNPRYTRRRMAPRRPNWTADGTGPSSLGASFGVQAESWW